MTEQPKLPDPEKVKRTVAMLRESNQQLEAFSFALDELIAQVEADIRRQPRNAYLLSKFKRSAESVNQD
jgi:hypothetical protein